MKAQKAFDKRFKQKESGKYDFEPVKQVMFGKEVEKVFEKESKRRTHE